MRYLSCPDEVDPVTLAESEHVEWIFPLDFVCLPIAGEDVVSGGSQELLGC
jgi:hypothetical protein